MTEITRCDLCNRPIERPEKGISVKVKGSIFDSISSYVRTSGWEDYHTSCWNRIKEAAKRMEPVN